MSLNLLNVVKDQLSDGVMNKLASFIGESNSTTANAVSSFLPTLLSGVVDKGSSVSGSVNLLKLISDNNLGSSTLNNLSSNFNQGAQADSWMKTGSRLLSGVFGNRQSSILEKLGTLTGLKTDSSLSLMSMLAPIVMGVVGKIVKSDNLDASGLMRLLTNQKSNIFGALPADMGSLLGFADQGHTSHTTTTQKIAAAAPTHRHEENDSRGNWWKWLLPLLLLLGGLWWFMNRDKGSTDKTTVTPETELTNATSVAHGHDHSSHDGHDHGTTTTTGNYRYKIDANGNYVDANGKVVFRAGQFSTDANGNLTDATGNILAKAGEFSATIKSTTSKVTDNLPDVNVNTDITYTKDDAGNLVDKTGKVVYKAGEFTERDGYYVDKDGKKIGFFGKVGKAIGDAAGAVGGAVGDAAGATADAFKGVFTGLFSKKEKKGTTHSLSKIVFDKDSHRITYYSKPEIEAMATALKLHPNSKIQVQVHTNDGKDAKSNKKLSSMRSEVLHDIFVTLGLSDKQVSYKGMGSQDMAKAAADKVDIFIEQ